MTVQEACPVCHVGQLWAQTHPASTSQAAVAGGPSAGCHRSWAPGCCLQQEAE